MLRTLFIRTARVPKCRNGLRWNHNIAPDGRSLEKIVQENIKLTGPISFARYMQLCLSHTTHGYYMNPKNEVFGASGDFITSPEISQVFGELIGIWFVSQWVNAGAPSSVRLVELGPGRGTLMDDVLRVVAKFLPPKTLNSVHLVETSQALRSVQKSKLQRNPGSQNVHWHDAIHEIPRNPSTYTMLVAHEFFDALPIHVIQKTEAGWNEIVIALATQKEGESAAPDPERFRRVLNPLPSAVSTLLGNSSPRFRDLPVGSTIEVSPTSFRIAHQVGKLLSVHDVPEQPVQMGSEPEGQGVGGCGLIIDYGADHAFDESFRAFKEHKIVDVFHQPGECDLTANVDFAYLKEAMGGLVDSLGPISQADFLERMALKARVDALARNAKSEERGKVILNAAKRLVDRAGMGKEYQVLGLASSPKSSHTQVWPFTNPESEPLKPKDVDQ